MDCVVFSGCRMPWAFGTCISLSWFTVGRTFPFMTLNSPQNAARPPWWRMYPCFITYGSCRYTEECASIKTLKIKINLFVLQPRQGQHEDDYTNTSRQESGSSATPFEETVKEDYLKSFSKLDFHFYIFQITSLQIRCLPSMTICYSLDVSSVSCLVQTKINMVNN